MAFRTLVILCLAATAGGIMTKGASEGSLPSQRRATRHRAAKDSDSGGLASIIADAVEGLAEGIIDAFGEADEADEMEMHKTSSDELESDDVDEDDEDDEDEGELSLAESQVMSALRDEYGERLKKVISIMVRGLDPNASEDEKKRAKKYLGKTAEIMEAIDASSATSAPEDAPGAEEEKAADKEAADKEVDEEKAADKEVDEVVKKVARGFGTIVDAVAPLATEFLHAVVGDDEDAE